MPGLKEHQYPSNYCLRGAKADKLLSISGVIDSTLINGECSISLQRGGSLQDGLGGVCEFNIDTDSS